MPFLYFYIVQYNFILRSMKQYYILWFYNAKDNFIMHLWNNFVYNLILSVMIDSVQHDRICILPSSPLYQNLRVQNVGWGMGDGGGEVTPCELLMEELNKGCILIMLAVVSIINNWINQMVETYKVIATTSGVSYMVIN